jgi:signal recognition particle receptor subunit beta
MAMVDSRESRVLHRMPGGDGSGGLSSFTPPSASTSFIPRCSFPPPGSHPSKCPGPRHSMGSGLKRISRQRRRLDETHAYLSSTVDPLMSDAITHLLCSRPVDVRHALLDFFTSKQNAVKNGKATVAQFPVDDVLQQQSISSSSRPVHRMDRLYMAREIGPITTELIHRALRWMPEDILSFFIDELRDILCLVDSESVPKPKSKSRASQSITAARQLDRSISMTSTVFAPDDVDDGDTAATPAAISSTQASPSLPHIPPLPPLIFQNNEPAIKSERSARPTLSSSRKGPLSARSPPVTGVTESQNRPWDVEVETTAKLPPSDAELVVQPGAAEKRVPCLLLLGMDGSGKTTLVKTLQGDPDPQTQPTVGFKPVTVSLGEDMRVKLYDVGGGPKIRGIWQNYFHDCHGIIFCIDGSVTDPLKWNKAAQLFKSTTAHRYLSRKPVLVLCNKDDASLSPAVVKEDEVRQRLNLEGVEDAAVTRCSVHSALAGQGGAPDPRLDSKFEWLLDTIFARWEILKERVQADMSDMEAAFAQEREQKKRNVLKKLLIKAFPAEGEAAQDTFEPEEGLEFLSSELGVARGDICADAHQAAKLVGYQKLALQMIGNMKEPVSKKVEPKAWEEILALLVSLREEVGLEDGTWD